MISFSDWGKKEKKEKKTEYEIVQSRSGLPMFVLPNDLPPDDEPVKKKKSIPPIVKSVCDFISVSNK
jgi:hypothetical protein